MSEQTPLPPFEDPRRVLSRHSLHPKKYMSQNFLVARSVVERIADAAEISADERVVELGPGLGTLTGELLRRGARVVAVEMDREMIEVLHAELDSTGRFEVLHGDAAEFDFGSVATSGPVKVLGNLPYAVTGAILRNLVSQRAVIERAVIMIQREVRDRLVAKPATRDYGALTVFTQAAFDVFKVIDVKPGSFHPPPKVSSAVVPRGGDTRLSGRGESRVRDTQEDASERAAQGSGHRGRRPGPVAYGHRRHPARRDLERRRIRCTEHQRRMV
jgi:16S rRNA (adenine1518-N6/adenine1519-N6)-dimethyltransferase